MPGATAYAASKVALRLFAKSAALECAQLGEGVKDWLATEWPFAHVLFPGSAADGSWPPAGEAS
jgi:hypothetical protein